MIGASPFPLRGEDFIELVKTAAAIDDIAHHFKVPE